MHSDSVVIADKGGTARFFKEKMLKNCLSIFQKLFRPIFSVSSLLKCCRKGTREMLGRFCVLVLASMAGWSERELVCRSWQLRFKNFNLSTCDTVPSISLRSLNLRI